MSIITFGEEDAKALAWVAAGAENSDPGALLIIDIDGSGGRAKITTNTSAFIREMSINVDEAVNDSVAIRAKAISSIASRVNEDMSMSVTIKDDRVNIACGSTSLSLANLYPHAMDLTGSLRRDKVASISSAPSFLASAVNAGSASPKGDVTLAFDNDGQVSIGARTDYIHTQELYPATIYEQDHPALQILGSHLKVLNPLSKIDAVVDVNISVGTGYVTFIFPITAGDVRMDQLRITIPTVVSAVLQPSSPCDDDIMPVLSVDRKLLQSALKPLTGGLPIDAIVTLDASTDGRLVVSIESEEGTGKTTILDSEVLKSQVFRSSLNTLSTGLKSISSPAIRIGVVEDAVESWMMFTPVDEDSESEDEEFVGGDIVIAVLMG